MKACRAMVAAALLGVAMVAGVAGRAAADFDRWEKLGSTTVTDRRDHDTVRVTGRRDYRAIRIKVFRTGVNFHRVVVRYRNGGDQRVEMRDSIPAGGQSRQIDLNGRDRDIRTVEFWYDNKSLRGRDAVVTVNGKW